MAKWSTSPAVALADGTELACVYVADRKPYIRHWGIYPEDDRGKRSVSITQVRQIRDSPNLLPAALADDLYRAGESGMGYTVLTVEFKDSTRCAYLTGNAVDFIDPLSGFARRTPCACIPIRADKKPSHSRSSIIGAYTMVSRRPVNPNHGPRRVRPSRADIVSVGAVAPLNSRAGSA